jgi:hypothetical protein
VANKDMAKPASEGSHMKHRATPTKHHAYLFPMLYLKILLGNLSYLALHPIQSSCA